ncbi:MAG: hypothetical protein VX278_10560 [Myxococcota bacterium]|nr:hypothetical protein [Myxococcota bacterium]
MIWIWLFGGCSIGENEDASVRTKSRRLQIQDLPSGEEKRIAVLQFLQEHPEEAQNLCPTLQNADLKAQCEKIRGRPHLWSEPRSNQVDRKTDLESKSTTTTCERGPLYQNCIEEAVDQAVRRGQISTILGLCQSIEQEKWRAECLFNAAEKTTLHRGSHGYAEGVELCFSAKPFSENCQNHLLMLLAQRAPSAHSANQEDWKPIFSAENAVTAAWSWRDPTEKQRAKERLWSEALGFAYTGVKPVTGDPLDVLPSDLKPHIHSAIARRLIRIHSARSYKLSTWVELAENSLQERQNGQGKRNSEHKFIAAADLWSETEDLANVAYMATSRRLWSEDSRIDLHIAILEAVARQPPAHLPLLEEGLQHANPLVRKTAQRLLSKLKMDEGQMPN